MEKTPFQTMQYFSKWSMQQGSVMKRMSRIDLVSKNLLANFFRNWRKRNN